MKNILLILLFGLSFNLYSQKKSDDYRKLIDSTVIIKATETYSGFKEELSKKNESDNWKYYINNYRHYVENIYLIDNNNQPYIISTSNDTGVKFKQIDIYNAKNKGTLKKGIDVWKIIPHLEGNRLKIVIINFKVTYKKKNYQFSNGGGTTVIFEYLCENKKWVLISNKSNAL